MRQPVGHEREGLEQTGKVFVRPNAADANEPRNRRWLGACRGGVEPRCIHTQRRDSDVTTRRRPNALQELAAREARYRHQRTRAPAQARQQHVRRERNPPRNPLRPPECQLHDVMHSGHERAAAKKRMGEAGGPEQATLVEQPTQRKLLCKVSARLVTRGEVLGIARLAAGGAELDTSLFKFDQKFGSEIELKLTADSFSKLG